MRSARVVLTVAVLAATATAHAVPVITIPDAHLVPGAANQTLAVLVGDVNPNTGEPLADPRPRVNMTLRVAINSGGPEAFAFVEDFGPGFGGPLGPAITNIEVDVGESRFGASIYSGAAFELKVIDPLTPQLWELDFEASDADEAPSNGLAALLTLDTTGLGVGHHTLDLTSSPHGPSTFGREIAHGEPRMLTISSSADITNNLFVDFDDLAVLLANWNEGISRGQGNLFNSVDSPTVDFDDLAFLLAEWTGPNPFEAPAAVLNAGRPVPEPSTLVLSVAGLLGLARRRRVQGEPRALARG